MNGFEFGPEEAVISWKGAFGSQRGFSDTIPRYGEYSHSNTKRKLDITI